jgi:hypothetical protein
MKKLLIKIDFLSDIKNFQSIVITKAKNPIILRRDSVVCDAKSLLGIFAIDTSMPFWVEYSENEDQEVVDFIQRFQVEED